MKKFQIPEEVLSALRARNPFRLLWDDEGSQEIFRGLQGPAKEIAERLLQAIATFPPPEDDFEIVDARMGLAGTGYTVTVATGTHLRVTVTAKYREAQQVVSVRHIAISPRKVERIRRKGSRHGG